MRKVFEIFNMGELHDLQINLQGRLFPGTYAIVTNRSKGNIYIGDVRKHNAFKIAPGKVFKVGRGFNLAGYRMPDNIQITRLIE